MSPDTPNDGATPGTGMSIRSHVMNTRRFALAASLIALPIAVFAQVKPGATAADVALYEGSDRLQKIVAGAQKEGALNIYTSAQSPDLGAVVAALRKKEGLQGRGWRARVEERVPRPGEGGARK